MSVGRYRSPEAFKQALEAQLRKVFTEQRIPLDRVRQFLVFDRFLVRITHEFDGDAMLKGGLALKLRLSRARHTKDVDLRISGAPEVVLERLRAAGRLDESDFFHFEVSVSPKGEHIEGSGMVYDGVRFKVVPQLAGKIYGSSFGLDVAYGDVVTGSPELLQGSELLAFAGLSRPTFRVYPRETHVAEKLHAYTLPRASQNSRVKDLPDFVLLAETGPFDGSLLRKALDNTFAFRKTHAVPPALSRPPAEWKATYESMARNHLLPWSSLEEVTRMAEGFLNPVLSRAASGQTWDPAGWTWR